MTASSCRAGRGAGLARDRSQAEARAVGSSAAASRSAGGVQLVQEVDGGRGAARAGARAVGSGRRCQAEAVQGGAAPGRYWTT